MSASTLIPINGGFSEVNGLAIETHVCTVFDCSNLEILALCDTHNRASEKATELFNTTGRDVRSGELRYFDENITAADLIGMTLDSFEYIHQNIRHPLINN